jgi:hypothetical protein
MKVCSHGLTLPHRATRFFHLFHTNVHLFLSSVVRSTVVVLAGKCTAETTYVQYNFGFWAITNGYRWKGERSRKSCMTSNAMICGRAFLVVHLSASCGLSQHSDRPE